MLDNIEVGRKSNLSKPLNDLADSLPRRGMVVLISDLLDNPDKVIQGLRHLKFRGVDVVVFHILDRAELTFPFEGASRFHDLETEEEFEAAPSMLREHYLEEINQLVQLYARELRMVGIDYCLLETSKPLDFALLSYLSARSRVS